MISTEAPALSYTSLSPPLHRGLAVLDRSLFTIELPVLAARVLAPETTKFARTQAKQFLLRLPRRTSSILPDPTSKDHRLIYLGIDPSQPIPDELAQILKDANIPPLVKQSVTLDYDYWTSDQIINSVLPLELLDESPSAFTQVGHIAHLNVRADYLPYRHLIGQIILDKNKSLRTVVNKLDTIDNEFRNFKMEVLAGDNDFVVQTSESNCMFHFDFSLVYWNSRLQGEHLRLVESFSKDDVVVDAFAGVGPFAVPAGKKGCGVLASDLNPASASALVENTKINKVEANVRTANEDARAFIKQSVVDLWNTPFPAYSVPISAKALGKQRRSAAAAALTSELTPSPSPSSLPLASLSINSSPLPDRRLVDHFVMNLPGSAIEFLDAFRGLYIPLYKLEGAREAVEKKGLYPLVHCYCFTKNMEDQEGDILERATKAMGMPVTTDLIDYKLRYVRDVAPKKEMYCLEFRLSPEMVM